MPTAVKKLDARLQLVADMVPVGSGLIDIGTDHAWLPVNLMLQEKIVGGLAADLNEGPLHHAREAVTLAGLQDKIALRLSDGLDEIAPHEGNCIVMAGMGGILISQLIDKAPWLKDSAKTLVLQPMTDAPLLRTYLAQQGFAIQKERATGDKKHTYTVMQVQYNGVNRELTPLEAIVGGLDSPLGENEKRFLEKEYNSLTKQARGLHTAGNLQESAKLTFLADDLRRLIEGMGIQ